MALLLVPMSIFAQKFGHFDSSAIIQLMPEYTTAQTEIQQLQAQYENDLKRMQDELKKKSEEYDKEKANLLDNVRQRREAELQDLYNRIQQRLSGQPKVFARDFAAEDAGYFRQDVGSYQADWDRGRLCLYHGRFGGYPLYQHDVEYGCDG